MKSNLENESKIFKIERCGIKLEFELFTKQFITKKLEELESANLISSIKCIAIPNERCPFAKLENYYNVEQRNKRYYYAYIKFFIYKGKKYGLVGGKSNYVYPDINFDIRDNTIARTFLRSNHYDWCREIIIVNVNEENLKKGKREEDQVLFLEIFLQRKFNLFDS